MPTFHDAYIQDHWQEALDAFKHCEWQTVVDDADNRDYTSISQALDAAHLKADNDGSNSHAIVLGLLAEACSMTLCPNTPKEPFRSMWLPSGRCATPEDFTESEIDFFVHIIEDIDNPLLKGRLADLVWHRCHKREFALTAIDSYRQLPFDADIWFRETQRCWQRAIDLCRILKRSTKDRLDEIESSLVEAIKLATVENNLPAINIANTLKLKRLGKNHSAIIAERLESLGRAFETTGDFFSSEFYYDAAAQWYKDAGDEDKSVDMVVAKAEAFVKDADARISSDKNGYPVAASFLEDAVQVYRSIRKVHRSSHNVEQRIQDLRLLMSEYGQRAQDNMVTVRLAPIDVSKYIEQACNAVSGKPLEEALRVFADIYEVNVEELHESAIKSLSETPMLASIPKIVTSDDGRVVAKPPGIKGSEPSDEDEIAIRAQMNHLYCFYVGGVVVRGLILPALNTLISEHSLAELDLIELSRQSPIVPSGRESLFGKALARGFSHDFATALHLLVPQIEHMVRIRLKDAGAITSHLDQNGIETENGLSSLVALPQMTNIFGEDMTYEIKALFCEPVGPNLRNNVAHGLLDEQEAQSEYAVYAWWLGLKLMFKDF